jgi:hypothetical protein
LLLLDVMTSLLRMALVDDMLPLLTPSNGLPEVPLNLSIHAVLMWGSSDSISMHMYVRSGEH